MNEEARKNLKELQGRKEIAKKMVDGLADMGMKYHEAESVLRLAMYELGNRRSDGIVSKEIKKETVTCPSCGAAVSKEDNFCKECSKKLHDVCKYCWVRKKDNYSCGESNCPGYELFRLEKLKSK